MLSCSTVSPRYLNRLLQSILFISINPSFAGFPFCHLTNFANATDIFEKSIPMYLVPIAWLYVATLMAVAEATSDVGTLLGAIVTFVLYGLLPVVLLMYIMGTPGRKRQIKLREAAMSQKAATGAAQAASEGVSVDPDASGHAPAAAQGQAVAPVRKEP
jgi:hypothetical protein